jgi:ribosome maturation protein SDO1
MVSVEDAVIARVTKDHSHFEILVDPDKALEFRRGREIPVEEIVAVRGVFRDARSGERVPDDDLERFFSTTDFSRIAMHIIRRGELQLTTEQRRRFTEEKRKQIAEMISRQGMNPQTRLPHPPQRILNAMEEAKVIVDPFRSAEEQMKDVVMKIQGILPISIEKVEIELRIPMQYAGKASSVVRNLAPVKKEEWRSDAWVAVIEIPAGMQADIYGRLNELTSGQVEARVIRKP